MLYTNSRLKPKKILHLEVPKGKPFNINGKGLDELKQDYHVFVSQSQNDRAVVKIIK